MNSGLLAAIIVFLVIAVCLAVAIAVLAASAARAARRRAPNDGLNTIEQRTLPSGRATVYLPVEEEVGISVIEPEDLEIIPADFDPETESETVVQVDEKTGKKVYYHYNFSFFAKLVQSPPEQQARYGAIVAEIAAHPALKRAVSWRHERIYAGKKHVANILFKGRRLCVAFALDPEKLKDSKYHGIDMRGVKRYANTPFLLKITSDRKARFACELLQAAAARWGIARNKNAAAPRTAFSIPFKTTEELLKKKFVKLRVSGTPAAEGEEFVQANIGDLVNGKVSLDKTADAENLRKSR